MSTPESGPVSVLLVSSKYPPEYSGSGWRAHQTARRLIANHGIQYRVITNGVTETSSARYSLDGIEIERISSRVRRTPVLRGLPGKAGGLVEHLARSSEALQTLRRLRHEDFQVLHIIGNTASTAAAMLYAARHDVPALVELVNVKSPPVQQLRFFPQVRHEKLRRTVCVAISPPLYERCKEWGLAGQTWLRMNPVDVSLFTFADNEERARAKARHGFRADDQVLLYVGEFRSQKNHEFLLEVMTHLPQRWRIVIAGPVAAAGKEAAEQARHLKLVKNLAERYGSRALVRPGFIDTSEWFRVADVYAQPSVREALGTVILEAIACGTPVVVNAGEGGMRHIVASTGGGVAERLNPEVWATAIEKMANATPQSRLAARDRVLEMAGSDRIDATYASLLEAMGSGSGDRVEALIQSSPATTILLDGEAIQGNGGD